MSSDDETPGFFKRDRCQTVASQRGVDRTATNLGRTYRPIIGVCIDSCVYVFFALYCLTAYVLCYCNTVGGPGKIEA